MIHEPRKRSRQLPNQERSVGEVQVGRRVVVIRDGRLVTGESEERPVPQTPRSSVREAG